jgi:hypothetical protein
MKMSEIEIKEIEVAKLNLQPGDVLAVTVKSDHISSYPLEILRENLKHIFPNNVVTVFGVKLDDEIKFSIVNETQNLGCGVQSYCADCSCGKKEQVEGKE